LLPIRKAHLVEEHLPIHIIAGTTSVNWDVRCAFVVEGRKVGLPLALRSAHKDEERATRPAVLIGAAVAIITTHLLVGGRRGELQSTACDLSRPVDFNASCHSVTVPDTKAWAFPPKPSSMTIGNQQRLGRADLVPGSDVRVLVLRLPDAAVRLAQVIDLPRRRSVAVVKVPIASAEITVLVGRPVLAVTSTMHCRAEDIQHLIMRQRTPEDFHFVNQACKVLVVGARASLGEGGIAVSLHASGDLSQEITFGKYV
jgi:hypothetical protein